MIVDYLKSRYYFVNGINTIRFLFLFVLVSILFLSPYYENADADTVMCKNDNSDNSCEGSENTDVLVGNKNSNRMNGLEGTDYILGLFGNDYNN